MIPIIIINESDQEEINETKLVFAWKIFATDNFLETLG